MDWYNARLEKTYAVAPVPTFLDGHFDGMIEQRKPDVVVVTTVDSTHHIYAIRAMELGCDVICEKPMTTDTTKAQAMLNAIKRTGRSLRVTFNMRYIPHMTKVRELMQSGAIGTPKAVSVAWMLNTSHGADYFRRWHREKKYSGGLLIHKSTHHFDLINWWIGSYPQTVFAMGALQFYGRENAVARGEQARTLYNRYTGRPEAEGDPFALNLGDDPNLKGLYLNAEADSGYIRDRNVLGDDITAEDTAALTVRYRNGVIMNYSLVCYSPWEGWNVAITGTKGRIEVGAHYASHIIGRSAGGEGGTPEPEREWHRIKVFPMFSPPYEVEVRDEPGDHGGGDRIMLQDLLSPSTKSDDPFDRAASHIDGVASMLVGASANRSIETGLPVNCDDLLKI
jgi:predicted dehydrogenase